MCQFTHRKEMNKIKLTASRKMFLQCKTLFLSRKEYLQISHNLCFTSLVFINFGQTIIEYIENKFKFNNFGIDFCNLTKSLAGM